MEKTFIPDDNSLESIKMREKIIRDFYREWKEQKPKALRTHYDYGIRTRFYWQSKDDSRC